MTVITICGLLEVETHLLYTIKIKINKYKMLLIVALFAVTIVILYYYGTRTFDYWSKKGVKHDPPVPFLGTSTRQFLQQISYSDIYGEMYWKYPKERFVGYYLTTTPLLILRDPELVKKVLTLDFSHFHGRSAFPLDETPEPMLKTIFTCDGDLWKVLRQRMSPAYSSGKLKAMFPLIIARAEALQLYAAKAASSGKEVNIKEVMARYTTDIIGAVGFGLDTDTLNDENSHFRKLGRRIFQTTKRDTLVAILKYAMPSVFKGLNVVAPELRNGLVSLVKSIMERRNFKPSDRNDFIDFLLELKAKGNLVGESMDKKNPDGSAQIVQIELDELLMAAQVFSFFAAGFESSSSASSYALHELALHPECQKKCQDEVDEVLARHENQLTFEAVKEMKYLEMCMKEGMRIFPSVGYLIRKCEKPYTIPDTNVTLDKGVKVIIPVKSLHMDPLYWDQPEQFRPDRFHPSNADNINKHVYLPFGEGPRACLGERLGHMQSLAGLAALLSRFSVAPSANTVRRPPVDPTDSVAQSPKGGLPLLLIERKKQD